jgi:sugar phosphate isomerase/epimerase
MSRTVSRRSFLASLAAGGAAFAARPRAAEPSRMCLAYTSFAVRMLQGRDILKSTAAALPATGLIELTEKFWAGGAQIDLSQLESHDPAYLKQVRARADKAGLWLELSVPSRYLETPESYGEMAGVAQALGVDRIRVALLYGRRYESFKTRDAWLDFDRKWRTQLAAIKPTIERYPISVGIENHKDFTAPELAALLKSLDSPRIGACVDFGNNISLLEDPLETIGTLAPFAVTTHIKDMAVGPYADGFELSEVPLGEGMVPLAKAIAMIKAARPDTRLCLEMITRDPLRVPYKTDAYWIAVDRPPAGALAQFERGVLGKAWTKPLPRISHLPPAEQVAAEDDNVRRSVAYAKERLNL